MLIRDTLVSAIIFASLPVCFIRPWVGILVWSWIGYMNPHKLTWGFATNMPFGQLVAVATLCGLGAIRQSLENSLNDVCHNHSLSGSKKTANTTLGDRALDWVFRCQGRYF